MSATDTANIREMIERSFKTVMAKDVDGFLALFAEDAVFFNPHYPVQRMKGKAAITDGIAWGLNGMGK